MGKIKKLLRNMSIRKAFVLYVIIFTALTIFMLIFGEALLYKIKSSLDDRIEREFVYLLSGDELEQEALRMAEENPEVLTYDEAYNIAARLGVEYQYVSSDIRWQMNVCDFFQWFLFPMIIIPSLIIMSTLFYRSKLKTPIKILNEASEKIANQELDFNIKYDSKDEMGKLCDSFESMRSTLSENYKNMWRSVENRKTLNAAFTHDLRTPLTVLKGQTDMLKLRIEASDPDSNLLNNINSMKSNINRLENFINNMNSIERIEDIEIKICNITVNLLSTEIEKTANIMCEMNDLILHTEIKSNVNNINADVNIIMQVVENILSNAVRFAKEKLFISIIIENEKLTLHIKDDGEGFSGAVINHVTEPFYSTADDETHFGLGLTISKLLCEKHGGNLTVRNSPDGGASVSVIFKIF